MIATLSQPGPLRLPSDLKARTRLLFLAKHAMAGGAPDPNDGNHAVYHHELRATLEQVGFQVTAADSYEALFARPETDFVIPLLNRGGFQTSEMLGPLLLAPRPDHQGFRAAESPALTLRLRHARRPA